MNGESSKPEAYGNQIGTPRYPGSRVKGLGTLITMTVLFLDVDARSLSHGVAANTWSVCKPIYTLE